MKSSFTSNIRSDMGTNASHRLRESGHVPAVIYGSTMNTLPVEIDRKQIEGFLRNGGSNDLVEVNIGGQAYTAFIKEIQRDAVTGKIIHLDFQQVSQNQIIHVTVPVILKGKSLVERGGVIVQQQLRELDIECSAGSIPKKIEFDISNFRPGDTLKVADMEVGQEISIVNDIQSIIASIAVADRVIDDEGESPLGIKTETNDRR